MAIKLGGDTNITLTNTSFDISGATQDVVVPLFTATSNGTYYFEGDLQDGRSMSTLIRVNTTAKDIWTYWDGVVHHVNCEFTLVAGDVVQILTAGTGQGRNFTVVRYADEIKEIYVGEGTLVNDYSAMQGPAPSGFHVPSKDEWRALYNIGVSLGVRTSSSGDAVKTYLKMPFAGYRVFRSAEVNYQGTGALCWSSNRNSASYAYYFTAGSTSINAQDTNIRANGYTVRCFKDTPVPPDSSWTTLYQGTGSSGIFHSSSLGLISLSSDGTTRTTIMDKNLGATTVYNDGDTLSEANCGKYFQWGNNYGFAWTGSVTTSSTQVDASDYGPGNYYSSSTFITRSSSPYRRDTTDNGNLWGGETGVQQKQAGNVTEVYVGTTKIRPLTN